MEPSFSEMLKMKQYYFSTRYAGGCWIHNRYVISENAALPNIDNSIYVFCSEFVRQDVRINLDDYLSWRKHLEQPSDDPNVPIFKRFDEYDFDNDHKFQQGLPSFIGQLIKEGKNTLDKAALQKEMKKAKAFYYARYFDQWTIHFFPRVDNLFFFFLDNERERY